MGVLAPNGNSLDDFWNSNVEGISGITELTRLDTSEFDVKIGGEIKKFDPLDYIDVINARKMDRFAQLGVAAAKLALDDAKLIKNIKDDKRCGVVIGSAVGGISFHEEQIIAYLNRGPAKVTPSSVPRITTNAVSAYIAIINGIRGINLSISTACSSGANAIGQALFLIRSGLLDVCVCGGVEAPLTPFTLAAYQSMKVLSNNNARPADASRPFDKKRDGFVLAEGAGILILENLDHALKRGARIFSELIGYGSNCGAYSMFLPKPDGEDAADAMCMALKDAGIEAHAIDYINAHGTGTIVNDVSETRAIKKVFGNKAKGVPISSTKSMIGHSIGAAGAIEAIICVSAIMHQIIPPTINLTAPDPDCDLDYIPCKARQAQVITTMSNSFGFGSNNAVLIFRNYYDE
jgi:3-oxoacyl-[acyl-carrier-protein] synthase II